MSSETPPMTSDVRTPEEIHGSLAGAIARARLSLRQLELDEPNPYLAAAGMFKNDPFADEVEACRAAARQRERDEAAREAGADA